jgi:SulP family sulfate permease
LRSLLGSLPLAVLAAIVIVAVLPLIRVMPLVHLYRASRIQFAIGFATFASTLALAPHVEKALIAGFVLAVTVRLWKELRLDVETSRNGDELHLRPLGVLWFGTARILEDSFVELVAQHPDARKLRIHLRGLGRIDITGAMALKRVIADAEEAKMEVDIGHAPPNAAPLLRRVLGGGLR